MGKLKKALEATPIETDWQSQDMGEPEIYTLSEHEFNYLMNVNAVKVNTERELNRVIAAFLHDIIAVGRLDYDKDSMLKFELDFEDTGKTLKIWKQKDLYKPTEQEPQQAKTESD